MLRNIYNYFGALAYRRVDFDFSIQQTRTFLEVSQAMRRHECRLRFFIDSEPFAVVGNFENNVFFLTKNTNHNIGGLRVFDGIVNGLLGNSIKPYFNPWIKTFVVKILLKNQRRSRISDSWIHQLF